MLREVLAVEINLSCVFIYLRLSQDEASDTAFCLVQANRRIIFK